MAWADRSLAMIATKAARMARPVSAPPTASSVSTAGRVTPPIHRAKIATTGSAMRASTFHTPVTMAEVEVARRVNPHERHMA